MSQSARVAMLVIWIGQRKAVKCLWKRVNIPDLIKRENKSYAEVAKIQGTNESSTREIMKREKHIRFSFAVAPQAAKVTPRNVVSA